MRVVAVLAMLALTTAGAAYAQVTTATLYGVVHDPSAAVLPGATVTLTNDATGTELERQTDANGEFAFDFVPVGTYTLAINMNGFAPFRQTNLSLRAGQGIRQTFTLSLQSATENVTVVGESSLVNTTSPEQSEHLSTLKVRDLPIAERNLVALGGLTTGSIASDTGGNNSGTLNFNGLGAMATSITVDGTDASSSAKSSQMKMFGGFNRIAVVSLEAVDEVTITKGILPAEYAPTMSGNINVITKSGTNQVHGSLFENWMGDAVNARPQNLTTKPAFKFNQFGGSLGGPLMRDKWFAFGTYEGYRRNAFSVVEGDVPTQEFRAQLLDAQPVYQTVLDSLPLPNQSYAPGAMTGRFVGAGSQTEHDNHFVMKSEYQLTPSQRISATYTRGRPEQVRPRLSPVNSRVFSGETDRVSASYTAFGKRWTAETRFGYNRNFVNRLDEWWNVADPTQAETQLGGRRLPGITSAVAGISDAGGEVFISGRPGVWSLEQKIGFQWGKHALKFGGLFYDRRIGGYDLTSPGVAYNTLDELFANQPTSAVVDFGIPPYEATSRVFGAFIQDDWRLTPQLVINLGLRYDYFGHLVAKGENGDGPFFYNPDGLLNDNFDIGPFRPVDNPYRSDALNLGPRVGVSYNPDGQGRQVFRAGAGIMASPIDLDVFDYSILASPDRPSRANLSKQEIIANALKFPIYAEDIAPLVQKGTGASFTVVDPDLRSPHSVNYYLGYERALTQSLTFETEYVGNRGVDFIMERNYNYPDRVTGIRPNPSIGDARYIDNSERTWYNAWQTSVRKRYSDNLTFAVHYTWSKVLAYGNGDIGDDRAALQDFFDLKGNKGPVGSDFTHYATADFVYVVPTLESVHQQVLRQIVGGWQLSGVFVARTGAAFEVRQSSAVGDASRVDATGVEPVNSNWQDTLQYLNPAAFQKVPVSPASGGTIRPGTLGKGALRAPGLWNLDLGLGKNFELTQGVRLQVRADMFNALNHTNWTTVNTNIDSPSFGLLTATAGARTMQLNARVTF